MSASTLGPLPEFGRMKGGLTGSLSGSGSQLDGALSSLLGSDDDQGPRSTRPQRAKRTSRDRGGPNLYSKLASLANESFDESEGENVPMTTEDAKRLADTVDVDDMEANLFNSFGRGQQKKSSHSKSRSSKPSKSQPDGSSRQGDLTTVPLKSHSRAPEEVSTRGKNSGGGADGRREKKEKHPTSSAKESKPPKHTTELDDDLLDLLSDGDMEDSASKKRTKPRIQLRTTRSKADSSGLPREDGKPITSGEGDSVSGEEEGLPLEFGGTELGERPGTSRGRPMSGEVVPTAGSMTQTGRSKRSSQPDILRLDSSLNMPRPNATVDFGDDDNDILSGMGLEDSDAPRKERGSKETRGSRIDDLLGTTTRKPALKTDREREKSLKAKPTLTEGLTSDGEEDGYMFGSYLPSAASGSSGKQRGLPTARRTTMDEDSLTSRPSSAPSSGAKKSVRFADAVETSDRPSSSPAANESSAQGRRRPKEREDTTKKPPLPRKSQRETESRVDAHRERDSEEGTVVLPKGETEPAANERPPSRGRGRSASVQKSSATKLFESGQDATSTEDAPADEMFTTEGPQPDTPASAPAVTQKLEHPTFPWQSGQKRPPPGPAEAPHRSFLSSSEEAPFAVTSTQRQSERPTTSQVLPNAQLVSFQEQLLQQQKQVQHQLMQLESLGGELRVQRQGVGEGSVAVGRLRTESKGAQERIGELEGLLEREKTEHKEKQDRLCELQECLKSSEEAQDRLKEECRAMRERNGETESLRQKTQLELTSQLDELKMKLHRVELERDQLRQSLEAARARHTEETETIQKSHEARVQAMEESFQRRETRWREEAEGEASRFQERVQHVEGEKTDAVLALRRKLDALEVAKTNEISRLQEVHRTAVGDLKREHEVDRQHLLSLHQQEMAALKAAHSHTRLLSDLSRQVEASSRGVDQLQQRVEHAHSRGVEEREQTARAQEEHLKVLEERLSRQQVETDQERERLQTLIARLEAHIAQQSKQIEQERWQLQQETTRLRAQQAAFEEERMATLKRTEEERDHLQQAKEKFLGEQREVLAQCYEERRSLASERAELSLLQRKALEREQRETQKSLQTEAELEVGLSHVREEGVRVAGESARLHQEQERLRREREGLERDREKLEAFGLEMQQRSKEIEEMCQSAVLVREQGEHSLQEAQKLHLELAERSRAVHSQMAELREREKQLAADRLTLARERRELHQLRLLRNTTLSEHVELPSHIPYSDGPESNSDSHGQPDVPSSTAPLSYSLPLPHTSHPHPHPPPPPRLDTERAYSPRASPVHVAMVTPSHSSVIPALSQLQHSMSLRQMAWKAEKDKEDLERENKFLESLQNDSSLAFSGFHGSHSSLTAT